MPQIFHRSTNTFSRVSIFGAVFFVAGFFSVLGVLVRSPYATGVGVNVAQPVQFSHKHHVGDDGIDCRYCHTSVEDSSFAGIPPTETCMNCHSQIWAQAPALEPVRESWRTGRPIQWARVHDLPDFVYFNHSIHVQKGFGCATCHGPVHEMALTYKAETLQMEWCLECHRNPAKYVRPREEVFNMHWQPPANQLVLGEQLVREYNIQSMTSCSICHR
jgi:hypothetical protein